MAKRFNFKLSLQTFQLCRSDEPSGLPKSPSSSTLFSPINPKSLEISYPTFPDPPPTPAISRIVSFNSFNYNREFPLACTTQKIYNSPVTFDSDNNAWPGTPPKVQKKKEKKKYSREKSKGTMSVSSADSGCFGSEEDDESESLMSSSENLDSSCDFGNNFFNSTRKKRKSNVKVRRLRRYISSNSLKSDDSGGDESPVKKSLVFRRLLPRCGMEGKVKESFAVVKNSEDPHEDFKRSMVEMILEKQMFEAMDLEQLLQCFLSLNSPYHHAVIVQAFSEIWEVLFL